MSEIIRGEKVFLCPPSADDLERISRWDGDDEISSLLGKDAVSDAQYFSWYAGLASGRNSRLFVIRTPDGKPIGDIALAYINRRAQDAELALVRIGEKSYWNMGYGRDAINALLDYAFGRLGMKRVYLRVLKDNLHAIRCYESCGFRREGFLKRRDGREVLLMSLLSEEWFGFRQQRGSGNLQGARVARPFFVDKPSLRGYNMRSVNFEREKGELCR